MPGRRLGVGAGARSQVVEARGTQSPLTVRDLFGTVRRAYAQADDVTARYDPASGVPQLLVVDIDERSPDEDVTYEVLRYRARG